MLREHNSSLGAMGSDHRHRKMAGLLRETDPCRMLKATGQLELLRSDNYRYDTKVLLDDRMLDHS
jgi:hypothetical protein